jgi:hypothetical protein
VSTHVSRLVRVLHAAALIALASGCGGERAPSNGAGPQVRPLRFAGVDLEYALERVAAEAGIPLVLDQITPEDMTPDLALYRVDVDLPAGPVETVLARLRENAGGFDYEVTDGVIYARSQLSLAKKTPLDLPALKAQKFRGNLERVVQVIMAQVPNSYITVNRVMGQPQSPEVEFELGPDSAVKDLLIQYARNAKLTVVVRRAGHVVKDQSYGTAIVGTTVEPRFPRKSTERLPQVYSQESTITAVADASARLKAPVLVLDRSVVMNTRGFLNLSAQRDPKLELVATLDDLGASGWGADRWHFKWKTVDGLPVIESARFLFFLRGRDLFRAEVLAGEFEGSLPELARWINTHQKKPTGEVLMGGEIVEGLPTAKLVIEPGSTVLDVLVDFAKASGVSPHVAVLDMAHPVTGKLGTHPNAWRGAYLQDLAEWRSPAVPPS